MRPVDRYVGKFGSNEEVWNSKVCWQGIFIWDGHLNLCWIRKNPNLELHAKNAALINKALQHTEH